MKYLLTSILLSVVLATGFSQGTISGNVTDAKTSETIPGVKIVLEGLNKGAFTDLDGNYKISGIPAGSYSLSFKYDTYNTKIVTDVVVKNGENTVLNAALESVVLEFGPVTVTVTINKESNQNLLQLQRNAASQVDGISSETIKKSPDRAASDVLKRISGASVQDNKFVIIRGLNDRYNTAMVNGLPLPSTEPDRKAFSFDIFPSIMVDNILIYKTASPDLPGDFAGGVIQINTKDIPDEDFLSISAGGSYNTQSTFKEYKTYEGSKKDWIGFGAADRNLPTDLPNTKDLKDLLSSPATRFEYSKVFSNDWGIEDKMSTPLGQNHQLGFAKNLKVLNNDFGIVGGFTYQNTRRYQKVERKDYNDDTSRIFDYQDDTYNEAILWGAMLNLSYKLGKNNKISFKNMYSNNSTDVVIQRNGENIDADQIISATAVQYSFNQILTSQLIGEHLLPTSKIKAKWGLNYTKTNSSVPNLKRMLYYKNRVEQGTKADSVFTAYVPFGVPSPDYAGRFFSDLQENMYAAMGEIAIPYTLLKEKSALKIGYAGNLKMRQFDARVFGYAINNPSKFDYDLLYLPQDEIFDEANIGVNGFKLGESTNPSDSYTASTNLNAGYLMTDQNLGKHVRAVYGLRVENFNQKLDAKTYGGDTVSIDRSTLSYLPSINLTYSPTKRINVRGAASKTVARPDFRELAPFSFYDFNTSSAVVGNDTLVPTDITNVDFRFEYYPGFGQMFSTTLFYKNFNNPIENTVFFGGSGSRTYTFRNVENAVDYGIEFEFRTKLSFIDSLFKSNKLDNYTVFTNLTLVKSEVDLSNVPNAVTDEEKFRPMQGQSPYIINAGLIYYSDKLGLGFSAMYNRIGRRIAFVGTNGYQDIYENPRNVLDMQIVKRVFKNGEVKLNMSDLFNNKAIFYQDFNRSKKFEEDIDKQILGITYGSNFSLSFSYKF